MTAGKAMPSPDPALVESTSLPYVDDLATLDPNCEATRDRKEHCKTGTQNMEIKHSLKD